MDDNNISDVLSECSDISYFSDYGLDLDLESDLINFDLSNGSPIDTTNFNIIHYNINSIMAEGRIEQLSNHCRLLNINVLVLTETKLDQLIPNSLLMIPGYHEPIRHDRNRNGGGVLVYVSEKLVLSQKTQLQSEHFEHVWIDVKYQNKTICINALYRPPHQTAYDHDLFLNTVQDMLEKMTNYDNASLKLVIGDMNFGNSYCTSIPLNPKPLDSAASDLFSNFGLKQLINIPTRVTENTMSLVDLIFVYNQNDLACHGTLPQIADHDGVIASFKFQTEQPKTKTKTIYDYKNADLDGLVHFIKSFNFNQTVFCLPVKEQARMFTQILSDAFTKFVPQKTITLREKDAPWCNNFTRLLLRNKPKSPWQLR